MLSNEQGTEDQRAARRWSLIYKAAGATAVSRAVSMICSLAQVPIALKYLGRESFGLWMTLTGAVSLLNFADLGIGLGIQNKISAAHGKDDMALARSVFLTGFTLLTAIAVALFAFGLLVGWWIDWASFFKIESLEVRTHVRAGLVVVFIAFCLGFPLSAAQKLAVGLQLSWIQAAGALVGSVVSLILVALAAALKLTLVPFLAVAVLPPILVNLGLLHRLFAVLRWRFHPFRHWDSAHARTVFGTGSLFVLPQFSAILLHIVPPVILSATFGAAAVAPFNVTQRLLGIIHQLQGMLLSPLWPAYAEARSRGDHEWIRRAFRKSVFHTLWAVPLPCLAFAIVGRPLVLLWTHREDALPDLSLLWMLSAWTLALAFGAPATTLLNGLGKLKGQSTYFLVSAVLSVLIMPFMALRFGPSGIPAALILTYGLIAIPFLYFEASLVLREQNIQPTL